MKVLCRYQPDFFMFNELCGGVQQWDLAVSLWRTTDCLGNSLCCLVISIGYPLVNKSIVCNVVPVLGCLVKRDGQLGLDLLHYLKTPLGPFIYFRQSSFILIVSSPIPFLNAVFHSPSHLILPFPFLLTLVYPYNLFCFLLRELHVSLLAPSSIPNLSESMDCSLSFILMDDLHI